MISICGRRTETVPGRPGRVRKASRLRFEDVRALGRVAGQQLLAEALPNRWAHSRGVGLKARELRELAGEHADILEAAAFVHDIGYAPGMKATGFHPLDGARYLRDETDVPELLCMLVGNHTCALIEASELLVAAITYCDLCVGPTGLAVTAEARVDEILSRYQPGDPVHTAIERARPILLEQSSRVELAVRGPRA